MKDVNGKCIKRKWKQKDSDIESVNNKNIIRKCKKGSA